MIKLLVLFALTSATAASTCKDDSHNCQELIKTHDICKRPYAPQFCKKTCGLCSGGGTGGGKGGGKGGGSEGGKSGGSGGGSGGGKAQCGVSKVQQSRVVNGVEAQTGAWPWIVSLQFISGYHFCGGTILTPNWVLTAAHCMRGRTNNPFTIRVLVGAHNIDIKENEQQARDAKRIITHPRYQTGSNTNADIALIQLSSPLKLNDRVVRACMPQQGVYPQVGKNCFIAGWGTTSHPGKNAAKLQQVKLPVVGTPHKGCHNNKDAVCVGYGFGKQPDGKQHPNACRGDSGGPLMCQRSDGSWQVEGVASYVYEYCKYYTAYAPVNKYFSWIKKYVPNVDNYV